MKDSLFIVERYRQDLADVETISHWPTAPIRGIAKMVEADRYCIDVVTQIEAARAAHARIESDLLRQHLGHCVHRAMNSKNGAEQEKVIEELVSVFRR